MKKLRYFWGICLMLLVSTACGQTQNNTQSNSMATVEDIISSQMAAEDDGTLSDSSASTNDTSSSATASEERVDTAESDDALVADVDLVGASGTIVYAEIYNMVTMPLVYHNKTVKLTGYYDEYYDVMTDTLYCSVFVMDALACCAQGLQIEFSDTYVYPDDYTIDGDEITIFATFEVYYPDASSNVFYYHLTDAILLE